MRDLIERLEKATGPDREMDRAILRETNDKEWKERYWARRAMQQKDHPKADELAAQQVDAPRYTASIDAALTLVPEGREWRIEQRHGKAMRPAYASVWSVGSRDTDFHANGDAKTPAIALCIAALKARTAVEPRPAKLTPQSEQQR